MNERIIDKCKGCKYIRNNYCEVYMYPFAQWRAGKCPKASHVKHVILRKAKERVGQQKQVKRKYKHEAVQGNN